MNRGQPGDFMRAAQICEAGLKVDPNNAQLRAGAVRAYFASNDLEIAVPHLEWLIKNRPREALPHAGIALVMVQNGQLDAAQKEAEAALDRDKDSPEGHLALGVVYLRKGQPLQARDQFKIVMSAPTAPRWLKDRVQQFLNEIK
jgi:tetratricopeptide (TPR) repeat protein